MNKSKIKQKGQNVGRGSHLIGLIGEGRFIAFAASQGWEIYRSVEGHTRCDFIVDNGERLVRVEVKRIESIQHTQGNHYYVTATKLDSSKFDYLYVSTPMGDYWIPVTDCPNQTLSVKVVGDVYERNITRPGKWEKYRVEE